MDSEYLLEILMDGLMRELPKKDDVADVNWTKRDEIPTEGILIIRAKDGEFSFNIITVCPAHISTD